jgi:hypothetical protein
MKQGLYINILSTVLQITYPEARTLHQHIIHSTSDYLPWIKDFTSTYYPQYFRLLYINILSTVLQITYPEARTLHQHIIHSTSDYHPEARTLHQHIIHSTSDYLPWSKDFTSTYYPQYFRLLTLKQGLYINILSTVLQITYPEARTLHQHIIHSTSDYLPWSIYEWHCKFSFLFQMSSLKSSP